MADSNQMPAEISSGLPGGSAVSFSFRFLFALGFATLALFDVRGEIPLPADHPSPQPEWELELFAEAPAVQHPAALACAPDGRIFVAEDPMDIRTTRADVAEGRIVCFHPDGRRTLFADSLYAAFGLQYLDGKLYALHNPFFSVWEDAGDFGTNRVDLIRNTNPNWHALGWNDHVPANFRLGLDGKFYVATGDKGLFGAIGRDGKRFDFFGGGIFRLRPDGTELEPFSTGVRNILDVALDTEDNPFTYDNTDEHEWMGRLTHMVDGGYYGYPHDFIPRQTNTLWCFGDFGAGAATGVAMSLNDALPAAWRGNLFLADFGKRNVLRVRLTPWEATFAVVGSHGPIATVAGMGDVEPLFTQTPEDFRPVGLTFTPDGRSLLIGDWQHRDVKDPQAHLGRLWKLTWRGPQSGTAFPAWYLTAATARPFKASNEELVSGLSHPFKDVRHVAQRRLVERAANDSNLAGTLRILCLNPNANAYARVHALWALHSLVQRNESTLNRDELSSSLRQLVQDSDPKVAGQAIRRAGEAQDERAVAELLRQLEAKDLMLRFRAATALGRIASTNALGPLLKTVPVSNSGIRYATAKALNRIGRAHPEAWRSLVRVLTESDPVRVDAIGLALERTYDTNLVAALIELPTDRVPAQLGDESGRARATRLLGAICRQPPAWNGEWWAYHPFRTPVPAPTEVWAATGPIRTELTIRLFDPDRAVRLAAARGLANEIDPQVDAALQTQFKLETDTRVRAALIRALSQRRDSTLEPAITAILTGADNDLDLVRAALDAAGNLGRAAETRALVEWLNRSHAETFSALIPRALEVVSEIRATAAVPVLVRLATTNDPAISRAAITALSRFGDEAARRALLGLLQSTSLETRRQALGALASRAGEPAIPELLTAWREPELRADALLALSRAPDLRALDAYLDGLGSKNPEQRSAARKAITTLRLSALPAIEAQAAHLSPEVLGEVQSIYENEPKAAHGPLFAVRSQPPGPEAYLKFALEHEGEAAHGRTLFQDPKGLNCLGCHRLDGAGAEVGPDLSNMGAQFGKRDLAESILWPSKVVREGYQPLILELKDGEEIAGLIKGESATLVTLRDSAGRLRQIPKTEISGRRLSDQSLMPEGLQAGLTLQEFADLVAFAASCRQRTKAEP